MKIISLNGKWKCKPDHQNIGIDEEWFLAKNYKDNDVSLTDIEIPNSFNTLEDFKLYEGVFWHFLKFDLEEPSDYDSFDYKIKLGGSNYNTKVWLNGEYLGENNGGFAPFHLNINKSGIKLKDNFLTVRTDNLQRGGRLPDLAFDWFNWGGIYRDINLLILNKNRISDVVIKTPLISRNKSQIEVSYSVIGTVSLKWEILDTDNKTILFSEEVSGHYKRPIGGFTLTLNEPKLWSPESPNLYYIKFTSNLAESKDEVLFKCHFGIRQIEIHGPYIYLNKRKIYLKGICLHEEFNPYGRSIPYEKRKEDVENMKSLGLNALRTAHYSHDEDLIDITDKLGLLVLEEIPVYWFCDYKSNETFKTGAKMMRNLIKRDINHPSIIMWSAGNEVPIEWRQCSKFFKRMMDWTRMLDDTRIVSYVSHKLLCDLTRRKADVACFNGYFGWYVGSPRMISTVLDMIRPPAFNKPWIYTEFGAGAKYGVKPGYEKRLKYSEEYQLYVLDYSIRTFNSKDYLAGWFLWAYRDFRAYLRQNEYQQGYNRKGIVSENNEKKLIYYRLPKIINQKRKLKNTKLLGIIGWIILFPLFYLINHLGDMIMAFGQRQKMKSGRRKELSELKMK